jgi:photosystem II stability/assembly factor-like uncharacterized protein
MMPTNARWNAGGTAPPTTHASRHAPLLGWLLFILAAALALLLALPARGATLSGTVDMPVSDGGYQPSIDNWLPAKVRVLGSALETNVYAVDRYHGTFTLTGVPTGPVTLQYVETTGEDSFTMDSKRLNVSVAGDTSGLAFNLVHHWKNLPTYPPPWRDPAYDIWEPYWVSSKVGFIIFLNRSVYPQESELWRTTTGGAGWRKIGHWVHRAKLPEETTHPVFPDITGRTMLFVSETTGVLAARNAYAPFALLRTGDGGATWTVIDPPNTPDTGPWDINGVTSFHNFARISSTRWIACGAENAGTYMGVGGPVTLTIWETADAGLTWAIKRQWFEDYAVCTAVDADKTSGRAVLFATPYAFGGAMHRELRAPDGTWTNVAGNQIIANSGYGSADLPMVGAEVWVSAGNNGPSGGGLFKSTDYGATFDKINDMQTPYMEYVSSYKGFAGGGGPLIVTYDGGLTWRKQSDGGGICCHGNYIWAFDTMTAFWKDGGVGDPNRLADIFMFVEPRKASFEILPGTPLAGVTASPGDLNVPVMSLRFVNHGPMPLRVSGLKLRASGSGHDQLDVAGVKAWLDRDANGVVDPTDTLLVSGIYPADDGELSLSLGSTYPMQPRLPYDVLVAYDFAGYVNVGGTFRITVTPTAVSAATTDSGTTLTAYGSAPAGTALGSSEANVPRSTLALASLTLKSTLISGCKSTTGTVTLTEPAPAAGVVVYVSDSLANATVPATVTVAAGTTVKTFTVKSTAVAANQPGLVSASLGPHTLSKGLTLKPMGLYSLSVSATTVTGGTPVNGTAKLECKAGPAPITVALTSSNPSVATPPASVTIPVGYTSGVFPVTTFPVTVSTKATLTAGVNGTSKSKSVTVVP